MVNQLHLIVSHQIVDENQVALHLPDGQIAACQNERAGENPGRNEHSKSQARKPYSHVIEWNGKTSEGYTHTG
jgi:hypothetical protein